MLRKPEFTPREIAPTEDGERLRIRWADGETTELVPRFLRLKCPCAGCVEEMTGRPLLDPSTVPAEVYPLEIRYMGRYALHFQWSDGHASGIYSFQLLRELASDGGPG
jgi:DUF971 family protein